VTIEKVVLSGLDGSNPLGFFAALGLLRVLNDETSGNDPAPRLSWEEQGRWVPVLHWNGARDDVVEAVRRDLDASRRMVALELAYAADGNPNHGDADAIRDLKPLPETLRRFQDGIAANLKWSVGDPMRSRRSVDLAAAFGNEIATDNNGRVKPTAFHFTAGQQTFLSMVRDLADGTGREHLEEALWGPWLSESKLPSLSWNAASPRIYALRASNPAKEKRGSIPGAEWLAFNALPYFSSVSLGRRLQTACVRGGWKDAVFTWPLWSAPITVAVARSLLVRADVEHLSASERASAGIEVLMRAGILRSEQGGYGSFTPALVV